MNVHTQRALKRSTYTQNRLQLVLYPFSGQRPNLCQKWDSFTPIANLDDADQRHTHTRSTSFHNLTNTKKHKKNKVFQRPPSSRHLFSFASKDFT